MLADPVKWITIPLTAAFAYRSLTVATDAMRGLPGRT
jgi:hypothetical protein